MSRKTLEDKGQLHSPDMACYYAVHNYPGGLPPLAAMMNMLPGTLQKKLNPACDTHKLSLAEAMHILRFTNDTKILDSICAEVGVVWFSPDSVPEFAGDLDLLESHSNLISSTSQMLSGLTQALSDGVIDSEEKAVLQRLKQDLHKAIKQVDLIAEQFEGEA